MLGERLSRWERVAYIVILILALFSRFYILGDRAISHDESIHTKFSWNLYSGVGFQHNPMMHGPLLFEVTALNYFLFGPNDFTSRIFPALMGVVLVMTPLLFRKWLGQKGSLATAALLLISPSVTYYSRYIRHDVLAMLTGVLLLWAALKYLDEGKNRWLYWMAAFFSLLYATKEVSYIYTALFGALLFLPFARQVFLAKWERSEFFALFAIALVAVLLMGAIFAYALSGAQVVEQNLDEAGNTRVASVATPWWGQAAAGLALLALIAAVILVYYGIGPDVMRRIRLFDVLMVIGTLTLPLGSAFLIKFVAGVDMGVVYEAVRTGNFSAMPVMTVAVILSCVAVALLASAVLGLWWDKERWPLVALIHYAIFFVLYSTIFTWGFGVLSGLVGSLAYWLAQQGVKRGDQPGYYYLLVGPLYEYLAILISAGAGVGAVVHLFRRRAKPADAGDADDALPPLDLDRFFPILLLGWTALSWVAYTFAGEKMPWLLVHIALPSIFLSGWGLGKLVDGMDWQDFVRRRGLVMLVALPLVVTAWLVFARSAGTLSLALQQGVSEAGLTLEQLGPFGKVLGGMAGFLAFSGLLVWSVVALGALRALKLTAAALALFLAVLTVRTMVMLNFINYDMATEFLVYAHSTPDIKQALQQIEDISWRTTGSAHDVKVAYGEDGSWPLTWYMVDYPNSYFYGTNPDPETLRQCPVVIAGSPQFGVVEAALGGDYLHFEYKYLWWPIQDYYNLTWERVRGALSDPAMRAALWDIIWKRDYAAYARLTNPENPFTIQRWPYRKDFRLYVRRDLAQDVWSYRLGAEGPQEVQPPQMTQMPDPYVAGGRYLPVASEATLPGAALRDLAVAADGSLYVSDTVNHRVWHITPQGAVLDSWGEYGTAHGQFNEPWGVAIDATGNVYVADTWNHRIQKFDARGAYLGSWGTLAQVGAGNPAGRGAFYGPRGIALGPEGDVYVTDTGNKRVQVFDDNGNFLREFGGAGSSFGQLDEPVGIAVSGEGLVYVADTWNRRVQVFSLDGDFVRQWSLPVWGSGNPEEEPFLALGDGFVYVGDPVHQRVLAFTADGVFQWTVGRSESGADLVFPEGMAIADKVLYVVDAHAGKVFGYRLP